MSKPSSNLIQESTILKNNNPSNSKDSLWTDLNTDLVAGVTSFSQCIALGNILNDEDSKLICADANINKMKVFKQDSLFSESSLHYPPVSIKVYYANDNSTKSIIPYLAVAGGPYIYTYRYLKGTFKLLIPNIEINSLEQSIWDDLSEGKIENLYAFKKFKDMAENHIRLSTRSLDLISLSNHSDINAFITENKLFPIVMSNYIICMDTIKKINNEIVYTASNIVVGTEGGNIFIIDSSGSKILNKLQLDNVPNCLAIYGAYESDYRIYVACRNEYMYLISNGEVVIASSFQISAKAISIIRLDSGLYMTTFNNYYICYDPSLKNRRKFSLKLPTNIYCMEICHLKNNIANKNFKGILIGLSNNEIRLYNKKILVTIVNIPETIMGIKFGSYGKYDNVLIIVSDKGSIYSKLLKTDKNLEDIQYNIIEENKELEEGTINIPKKTTLYVDLMEREKENYQSMHHNFQNNLSKIKYKTLDTYCKLLLKGHAPQNYGTVSKIKINVSINGYGPNFKLIIELNNSGKEVINSVDLLLDYEKNIFDIPKDNIQLGLLMPHVPSKYSLRLRNISENGVSGDIKIIIVDKLNTTPLIVNRIKLPVSELELI